MERKLNRPVGLVALLGGVALLAAGTGAAFASWLEHGPAIFVAMVDAGLSWCF